MSQAILYHRIDCVTGDVVPLCVLTVSQAMLYHCTDCKAEEERSRRSMIMRHNGASMPHGRVYTFNLRNASSLYELSVPTCSYRNGILKTGYGAAIFGKCATANALLISEP